tara:strand:+ start:577 stop:1416 length:840 start_codon:yes stop_codon:yes gene_type:complete
MNLNELFDIYLKDLKRRNVKTAARIVQFYKNDIMSVLGDREVTDIIRGDIASLLFDITDRSPYTSNKCLSILKAMFNLAITLSYLDVNPCTNIPRNREVKRKRYITNDELLAITEQLDHLVNRKRYRKACNFIKLLIMTGARVGEIRNARWSDIQDNMLVIKEHKSDRLGEDRIIHITPGVQKILDACERDSEFIIGIVSPRSVWKMISERAGCADARLHDIRHSYASWSLQKVNLSEVGNLLGHRDVATTQRYAHIHKERAIENANVVSNHIESILRN